MLVAHVYHARICAQYDIWTPSPFLVAGGFKQDNAVATAEKYDNSVIVFGRYFISNPDLVERVKEGVPFADYDRDTFYKLGPSETKGELPLAHRKTISSQ